MLPVVLGIAGRLLGGAVARGAAARLGASAAVEAGAGRAGQFVGGALANSVSARHERETDDAEATTPRRNSMR